MHSENCKMQLELISNIPSFKVRDELGVPLDPGFISDI